MKVRDSGMPEQQYWESLFDVDFILDRMGIDGTVGTLVEFGCGYGTFTAPGARRIGGTLIAFDIEEAMLNTARKRMGPRQNVVFVKRDFIADGTGISDGTADYVMLFNILYHSNPSELLFEAIRILKPGGKAGIIHWNYDPSTPRGPSLNIRPRPEDMKKWILQAGFQLHSSSSIDLPPYHYGYLAYKP